jgi:hypothetical protein
MSDWLLQEMKEKEADGVIFHALFDGKDGIFRNMICEYTIEQVKTVTAIPKSGRTYYKIVNGRRELIK